MTMTRAEISSALPASFRGTISQEVVDSVNNIIQTSELKDVYKEQFLWFGNLLKDKRFTLTNYVNAVRYVALKSIGHSNISAWSTTFPERFDRLKKLGKTNKEIQNHVRGYHNSVLVSKMLAQAMVPAWLVNQHNFQEAINTQVDLMRNAKSETVRCNAANSIISNLSRPDSVEMTIDETIGSNNQNSPIEMYKLAAKELAKAQIEAIKSGVPLVEIAESEIKQKEVNDG